jgi:hypothetical protein
VAQVVEYLLDKHEALPSNPVPSKKTKEVKEQKKTYCHIAIGNISQIHGKDLS